MPFGLGLPEIAVIGGIFVLLFGGKRIGELGKGLGQSIKEFRKATSDLKEVEQELKK